jgi:hypothetical protein
VGGKIRKKFSGGGWQSENRRVGGMGWPSRAARVLIYTGRSSFFLILPRDFHLGNGQRALQLFFFLSLLRRAPAPA